jgi:hypothetical protein
MEECSFVYDKEMYGTHTNAVLRGLKWEGIQSQYSYCVMALKLELDNTAYLSLSFLSFSVPL